jgi:small subunit ribosomal protein S20
MATHKSAAKRARQNDKRRERNKAVVSNLRAKIRDVREGVGAKTVDEMKAALEEAVRTITQARSKGVLHRKNAARKVSRLTKLVQKTTK